MSGLPKYTDSQLQTVNRLFPDEVKADFGTYASTLRADPATITLPNGQDVMWAAATKGGDVTRFAIGFNDSQGNLVTAMVKDGKIYVGAENAKHEGWGPAAAAFNMNSGNPLNNLNRERIFKEARTMVEATAEAIGVAVSTPPQFKDDMQQIDRTMEQQLGVTPRNLVTP